MGMFNKEKMYKSATPPKLKKEPLTGSKKIKSKRPKAENICHY